MKKVLLLLLCGLLPQLTSAAKAATGPPAEELFRLIFIGALSGHVKPCG
jgi:hypothetical protein